MALGDVVVHNVTLSSGVLDVSAGAGIYNVGTQGNAPTDTIQSIVGHSHPNVYELRVRTAGQYWTLQHNVANGIRLMYGMSFETAHPDDSITLRTSDKGPYLVEFIQRSIVYDT